MYLYPVMSHTACLTAACVSCMLELHDQNQHIQSDTDYNEQSLKVIYDVLTALLCCYRT